jgi:hypothetical protein
MLFHEVTHSSSSEPEIRDAIARLPDDPTAYHEAIIATAERCNVSFSEARERIRDGIAKARAARELAEQRGDATVHQDRLKLHERALEIQRERQVDYAEAASRAFAEIGESRGLPAHALDAADLEPPAVSDEARDELDRKARALAKKLGIDYIEAVSRIERGEA